MSWLGTILHYMWRLCTVGSRVMTLAVFATAFTYQLFIVWGAHWALMVLWILLMVRSTSMTIDQGCSRSIDLGGKDQDLSIDLDLFGDLDHHH